MKRAGRSAWLDDSAVRHGSTTGQDWFILQEDRETFADELFVTITSEDAALVVPSQGEQKQEPDKAAQVQVVAQVVQEAAGAQGDQEAPAKAGGVEGSLC